jgi:hypothetical protein
MVLRFVPALMTKHLSALTAICYLLCLVVPHYDSSTYQIRCYTSDNVYLDLHSCYFSGSKFYLLGISQWLDKTGDEPYKVN